VLVGCFDVSPEAREALAGAFSCRSCGSVEELLAMDLDVMVVATVHRDLAALSCAALEAGSHVLVEKPAAMSRFEIETIQAAAKASDCRVKVGFNHRFFPGIRRAVTEALSGEYGSVMFMRARYGHGGRVGYDREWRMDPVLSGGGELVDQGMHLLDLSRWLIGEVPVQSAWLPTSYWDTSVEDNAVIVLGERSGASEKKAPWALLHASWTEWKNLFSLEIYCEAAKFAVDGLCRSYGAQRLRIYRMTPELGPPRLEQIQYGDDDKSFLAEWDHFAAALDKESGCMPLLGDLASARYAWECIERARSFA
jgi:predicted dehydrogenase